MKVTSNIKSLLCTSCKFYAAILYVRTEREILVAHGNFLKVMNVRIISQLVKVVKKICSSVFSCGPPLRMVGVLNPVVTHWAIHTGASFLVFFRHLLCVLFGCLGMPARVDESFDSQG